MTRDIPRRDVLHGAAALFAAALAGPRIVLAESAPVVTRLAVNAKPIVSFDPRDATHLRYGALQFRSGLVLTSSFKPFGGLSALRWLDAKGERFLMLSDKGDWFTGRVVYYKGTGLAGLADVTSTPMRGGDGKKITTRGWFDSESLAFDGETAYVGLERVNQILRFDFSKGGIVSRGDAIPLPPGVETLPFNKGLETLVFVARDRTGEGTNLAGTLIAISERGLDAAGNLCGFLIGGPMPGVFTVKRSNNYDISDGVLLPSGDLLILERKFSLLEGVGIRIRRMPISSLAPGALMDGPVIFEVDLGYEVDNMEGIDFHVTEHGETVLTLISDDNFSMIQRTLLLQFTLVDE
jgi:hypothetical protein